MAEQFEVPIRQKIFIAGIAVMFALFLGRLVQLQILYQNVYGKKSEENSIRPIAQEPIRGYIFDRNGKLIVDNRPSYSLTITPAEFHPKTIDYLASLLNLDPQFILDRVKTGQRYNRFAPVRIKRDIDFATLSAVEENKDHLPGIDYQIETKRFYPTKARASHVLGYTKEISEHQLEEMAQEYRLGDDIGATGLEAAYERALRGRRGFEFVTVNAKGQIVRAYNEGKNDIPVKEGDDLSLALDIDLQAYAESLLEGKHGAIVAIDPEDGGVLALASKPDFDLSLLSGFTPTPVWNELNTDEDKPLFNRATLTRYPPGSTFKMVLATAALQESIITTSWRVSCAGGFRFGNKIFKDLHVHGSTNVVEALQRSCNVFFYQLMLKTGLERWNFYGRQFGFGSPTGIDILEEDPGLLPSEEYFDRVYGKGRWTQGFLVSLGIGQGEVGVSPLQMACYAMAIGNRGKFHTPHVVRSIYEKETGRILVTPIQTRTLNVSSEVWDIIRDGLYRCVNVPGGTGLAARVQGVIVAGKTGTAENPHGKDHAWFIGYAPADHPKIAICVLLENAGFGGAVSAPIAGLCIEKYLYGNLIRYNKTQQTIAMKSDNH
ncbi:MAG: penicillin-binding protein 2 [Bacteroidota bacterium]|jgi:penicillin-binding protein 2